MTARSLVIMRHAKAEHVAGVPDTERALTQRGMGDATAAGAWLVSHGYQPELVLCSPSRRTRQTWHAVAVALSDAADPAAPLVRYESDVYHGGTAELLELVRELPPQIGAVLLIGHNPALTELCARLDPTGELDSDGLRTAGIAVHRSELPWSQWQAERVPLVELATPRA
ncbi:MAG TPA: histidine phosphatase family protein [Micromonosporaceae bacterium]